MVDLIEHPGNKRRRRAMADHAVKLLKTLEWSGSYFHGSGIKLNRVPTCPMCGGLRHPVSSMEHPVITPSLGHHENCKLGRLLKDGEDL